jgi:hypothetical protein
MSEEKNRYARALAAVTAWCRINRHQSISGSGRQDQLPDRPRRFDKDNDTRCNRIGAEPAFIPVRG